MRIELSPEQLQQAVDKLPVREKIRLLDRLERATWQKRFKELLRRIDARLKKSPVSQREISRRIENARNEFYARSHR